jgi:hypothetical protein
VCAVFVVSEGPCLYDLQNKKNKKKGGQEYYIARKNIFSQNLNVEGSSFRLKWIALGHIVTSCDTKVTSRDT